MSLQHLTLTPVWKQTCSPSWRLALLQNVTSQLFLFRFTVFAARAESSHCHGWSMLTHPTQTKLSHHAVVFWAPDAALDVIFRSNKSTVPISKRSDLRSVYFMSVLLSPQSSATSDYNPSKGSSAETALGDSPTFTLKNQISPSCCRLLSNFLALMVVLSSLIVAWTLNGFGFILHVNRTHSNQLDLVNLSTPKGLTQTHGWSAWNWRETKWTPTHIHTHSSSSRRRKRLPTTKQRSIVSGASGPTKPCSILSWVFVRAAGQKGSWFVTITIVYRVRHCNHNLNVRTVQILLYVYVCWKPGYRILFWGPNWGLKVLPVR